MRKETVCLCMIVKDEEDSILSCISSASHLVDEIVVVDTGSKDRSVQLALEAGARVFSFPWSGDFAQARNYALAQSSSNWILVLDADEVLGQVTVKEFERLLNDPNVEGYFLEIKNYLGDGREASWDRVVRLFRKKPCYKFTGAIHEQVAPSILEVNCGKSLAAAPLVIHHYGYLKTQLIKKDKTGRNTLIIRRELDKFPNDPYLHYCLAIEHYQREDVPGGLACLEKALAGLGGAEGYYPDVVLNTALGLLKVGRLEELICFTSKALGNPNGLTDLYLLQGLGYLGLRKYREAAENLERTLEKGGTRAMPGFGLLSLLGDAYNLGEDYYKAEKTYLEALKSSAKYLYPLTQMLGLFQKGRSTIGFNEISRYTSLQEKKETWQDLVKAGEVNLAAVVLLLSIYELSYGEVEGENLFLWVSDYSRIIPGLKPLSGNDDTLMYLVIAGWEMAAYAKIVEKGLDWPKLSTGRRIQYLVKNILYLLITEYCPRWKPGSFSL